MNGIALSDVQRPLLYELSASDVFAELVLVGLAPPVRMSELVHHVPLGALAPLVGHGQRSAQDLFFFEFVPLHDTCLFQVTFRFQYLKQMTLG